MNSNHVESGTSFAVPYVCANLSLILEAMLKANPRLGNSPALFDRVVQILQGTATRLPNYPVAAQGAGVINPEAAVAQAFQVANRSGARL